MEVEIFETPSLSETEEKLLGVHSFINILNIIMGELRALTLEDSAQAEHNRLLLAIQRTKEILGNLHSSSSAPPAFSVIEDLEALALDGLDFRNFNSWDNWDFNHIDKPFPADSLTPKTTNYQHFYNLEKLFYVLKARYQEYLSQHGEPLRWIYHDVALLKMSFYELFRAVELNSKGRFRIVHNLAEQSNQDYLIHFDIYSVEGASIYMPLVLHDVTRDLILNARKYTPPGGRIVAGLIDTGKLLRFVVQDSGIGIPDDEMEKVVNFGYRGTNIGSLVRQYGGGFGLTKAYATTKKLGGRFWISSQVGIGTRITLEIPSPM